MPVNETDILMIAPANPDNGQPSEVGQSRRLRIVLLTSDDHHHKYLAAHLCERFDVAAVVVEPAAEQRRRLRRLRRWRDYAFAVYHSARRKLMGLDAYRRRRFALGVNDPPRPRALHVVRWINDDTVVELLRREKPDVTVVICTSILRRPLLDAAGLVINVHGGHLPDYRGNHCFFWALYEGRFDRVGSTIHFVDVGIDTGDIIEVVVPPIVPRDTPETLYCRSEMMAIHRLLGWLEHYRDGGQLRRAAQSRRGRLFNTRDRKPHHDLVMMLRRLTGRLRVPARPAPA